MQNKKKDIFRTVLRVGAVFGSIYIGYWSITYSVTGLNMIFPGSINLGWGFGFIVILLELIFNRGIKRHPTLYYAGVMAYVYSISTNFIGLLTQIELSALPIYIAVPGGLIVAIGAATMDILPEAFLVWAIWPDDPLIGGDFVSAILSRPKLNLSGSNGHGGRQPDEKMPFGGLSEHFSPPTDAFPDGFGHTDAWTDKRTPVRTDGQTDKRTSGRTANAVRSYVFRHIGKDGSPPSVRDVAIAIGKDKSTVGEIMAEMRRKGQIK